MIELNHKEKIILVGSTGFIGSHILYSFPKLNIKFATSSKNCSETKLDLNSKKDIENLNIEKGDFVIITATAWSPEYKNISIEESRNINIQGTRFLIEKALEKKAKVIYFSSDTVYGVNNNICLENTICYPIGDYAKMKNNIENIFHNCLNFKSLRLSYVFAKNDKFTNYLLSCSDNALCADVFDTFYRSIICIDDICKGLKSLIIKWDTVKERNINFGGPKLLSRMDIAQIYKNELLKNLQIKSIEPPKDFFLTRPAKIELKSNILNNLIEGDFTSLQNFIKNHF